MRYFIKSMCDDYVTIYQRATYLKALRFARKLRSEYGVETHIYTDKGDSSTWNKATWNEFYAGLIKEFKEVCDD